MSQYSAQRTLGVRVELIRQVRRRRTAVAFAIVIALPVVVVLAVLFGPSSGSSGLADGDLDVFGLMASGPWNFALSGLFFSSAFLLVILAAMFLGDTVASEASWGTMRYLLVAPVPRRRFLFVKMVVGLLLTCAVLVVLVITSFLLGLAAFGSGTLESPLSGTLGAGDSSVRLAIVAGYIAITLLVPAGIAFLASVSTDVPLGAVGAAVVTVIFTNILDAIDALGSLREFLPANYAQAWADALGPVIKWDQMATGLVYNVGVFVLLVGIAVLRFDRKDILS
ncbi:MAG: ABC transporter permease [Acidimicrobiia bacterium]|nr:ABC transporter permease [Acidimicrobiia bacterium]